MNVGKVVCHPSSDNRATPLMRIAEAMDLAAQMETVCIMWTDERGNFHIGWSKMSASDLAAYGAVLTHVAASRLVEDA